MQKESVNLRSKQSPSQEKGIILEFPSQENLKQDQLGRLHTNSTSTCQFGLAGEALTKYLLHMWNYSMCSPLDTSAPFDLLVKGEKDWITIQIKHTTREDLKLKRNLNGGASFPYKQGDFDYLFVCKFPYIYIVPFSHIKTITCFALRMYKSYRYDLMDKKTYENKVILTKEENERTIN